MSVYGSSTLLTPFPTSTEWRQKRNSETSDTITSHLESLQDFTDVFSLNIAADAFKMDCWANILGHFGANCKYWKFEMKRKCTTHQCLTKNVNVIKRIRNFKSCFVLNENVVLYSKILCEAQTYNQKIKHKIGNIKVTKHWQVWFFHLFIPCDSAASVTDLSVPPLRFTLQNVNELPRMMLSSDILQVALIEYIWSPHRIHRKQLIVFQLWHRMFLEGLIFTSTSSALITMMTKQN